MIVRRLLGPLALFLAVAASGCCHDHWCFRPCAHRCQPACCPETSCGCSAISGYVPAETFPPPPAPLGPVMK